MALAIAVAAIASSPNQASAQDPGMGDLRALQFYLQQGNDSAADLELQRLRAVFPEWSPPEDLQSLFTGSGPINVEGIYDLIAAGEFDAARNRIAELDAQFEDWTPPADMLTLLSVSEAQADFDTAVANAQSETVLRIARGIPALLACDRINNAWNLAEAHLALGQTDEALRTYRAIVGTCADPDILVATLEKANQVATIPFLADLSDTAQALLPAATGAIRRTENRLLLGRGEDPRWENGDLLFGVDETPEETAPSSDPQTEGEAIPSSPPAPAPAPTPAPAPAPPVATTNTAPRPPVTAPSAQGSNDVQAAAERGDWARCIALSTGSTRPDIVYQRGWCAYNLDRPLEAISAFQTALGGLSAPDQRRDANYGIMLAMLSLDMTEQAAQLAAGVPLTRDQRITIEGQILDQRGVAAYERGDYNRAIAFFQAHEQLTGTIRRDLALLEGYSRLNLGDRRGARQIFLRLHQQLATPETRAALQALERG